MENTCIDPTLRRALAGSAKRLYFIGICGISMSGLAVMAKMRGWEVAGCDRAPSCAAAHALFRLGISVEAALACFKLSIRPSLSLESINLDN